MAIRFQAGLEFYGKMRVLFCLLSRALFFLKKNEYKLDDEDELYDAIYVDDFDVVDDVDVDVDVDVDDAVDDHVMGIQGYPPKCHSKARRHYCEIIFWIP